MYDKKIYKHGQIIWDDKKLCPRCDTVKPLTEFNGGAERSTGFQSYCKHCDSEYRRENRYRIAEKLKKKRAKEREYVSGSLADVIGSRTND